MSSQGQHLMHSRVRSVVQVVVFLACCRAHLGTTSAETFPLSFVLKNIYGSVSANAINSCIEAHRPTYFTAVGISSKDLELNLKYSSPALLAYITEYQDLVNRGGSNAKAYGPKIKKMRKQLKISATQAEVNVSGIILTWSLNGSKHTGRTIGPLSFKSSRFPVEVNLVALNVTSGLRKEISVHVPIRHLRRSFDKLMTEDKRRFLSAGRVLYRKNTEDGRREFGPNYVGMQDLWAMHSLLAADDSPEHLMLNGGDDQNPALQGKSNSMSELRGRAKRHWKKSQSYIKEVDKQNWRRTGEMWMQIDGDTNDYSDEHVFDRLLKGVKHSKPVAASGGLLGDSRRDGSLTGALMTKGQQEGVDIRSSLIESLAQHNVLATMHDGNVLSNFAAFALIFERSIQAVDPMMAIPYFDEHSEAHKGHTFPTSTWTETFNVPKSLLEASCTRSLSTRAHGAYNEDEESDHCAVSSETITLESRWAYVPVITGQTQQKGRNGKPAGVYTGFSMPLIMQSDMP